MVRRGALVRHGRGAVVTAYTVNRKYTARRDGALLGPWDAGQEVDLADELAEWVNRDSPGVLTPASRPKAKPAAAPEPVAEDDGERAQKPVPNRQHRGGRNRAT